MAILTLATVLSQARTLLNDDTANQFPDPVLIPKTQLAHQELQTALWDCNSPTVRGVSTALSIANGSATVATPPADMLVPFMLMESSTSGGPWTPMTEVFFISSLQLAGIVQGATLKYWAWMQDIIQLLGSTNTCYIVINYRRQITLPVAAGDSLGIPYAEQFLSYRTAALAGGSLGDPNSLQMLSQMADLNLARVIAANRGQQRSPINQPRSIIPPLK
jgi:hypothetical protein